jgi:hypothetical protein
MRIPTWLLVLLLLAGVILVVRVDDQCRHWLAKFRPQEVPWVPRGSGPSSYPKRPFPYRISQSLKAHTVTLCLGKNVSHAKEPGAVLVFRSPRSCAAPP